MLSPAELKTISAIPASLVMDEPVSAVGTSAGIDMLKLLQHHSVATIVTDQADSNDVPETLFAQVIAL